MRHENRLNGWLLYGGKQLHGLSNRLSTNKLKDRQAVDEQGRKTKYSGTNTDKDKMHGKTKTVARIESRKTTGSLPLIYYVMWLTFYSKIFP